ncbi:GDP-L-fucose synthase family protein [Chloroflexota bacterium]
MNPITVKRFLVTGGAGFLGNYVVKILEDKGVKDIFIPRSKDYNLVEMEAVKRLYRDVCPDIVIHLAAKVGGIGITKEKPGEFFYENLMMGVQMMEQGRLFGIDKFVAIGTVCAYPKDIPIPFKEENLWYGYPEETNAPYGLAKKMTLVQAQAYRQQYGFNAIYLLPVNLYGPGDNFTPESSHVIPALIKKCIDAIENNENEIVVWGTGKPTREYLYIEDAAEGVVLTIEKYNKPEPVNLGSGFEISIMDLVNLITRLTGFKGLITWDTSKPDGQPRRLFDNSLAEREFTFKAKTDFEEGLEKTIEWYKQQRTKGLVN